MSEEEAASELLLSTSSTMSSTSSPSLFVQLCGNLAPIAAVIVFCAPIPTMKQISNDQSVGSLPLLPYSSMVANCFLWLIYGLLKNESKVYSTNFIGLCLAIIYFIIFQKYYVVPLKSTSTSTLPGTIKQHIQACTIVVCTTLVFVYFSPPLSDDPASIIGNIAVLFCVTMFASPLAALKTVLITKSADSIPLPFTIATCMNCFCWSILGLFDMNDFNIYFPNLLGLSFGLAQVVLKLIFGGSSVVTNLTGKPGSEKLDLIA